MIPLRLTVKNFMCYRDNLPPLDLEGVHVACLCGDNGHGKTALLDAMTWALWGEARTRTQDELIHQGQQDMAVELDFLARGQKYRVIRKYSRTARSKSGHPILEFQVTSENGYVGISGSGIRDTEEKICQVLHMDYDTFINTAFLRQGDADRFTTARPSERKQYLAEMLDLSYYQQMEERAKARSRTIQEDIRNAESAIVLRQQEIARRPEFEEQLVSVKETLSRLVPQVETLGQEVVELRRSVDSLQLQRHETQTLARRLADSQRDIEQQEKQKQNHVSRVGEYEAVFKREVEIREKFTALEESRAELDRMDLALTRKNGLDKEKASLEGEIAVQKERLSGQAEQLRKKVSEDLEPKVRRLPEIEASLDKLSVPQPALEERERALQQQRIESQDIIASISALEQANAVLRDQMKETRKKYDMLEQGETLCPLCNQPLGEEGQQHLRQEYQTQGRESKSQHQENTSEKSELEEKHKHLDAHVSATEAELRRERQRTESRLANLKRDRDDSLKAKDELQHVSLELEAARTTLDKEDFAHDERRILFPFNSEISDLRYDPDSHHQTRGQVKTLEPYNSMYRKLVEAAENLPTEREALDTARQMLERRRREVREAQERKTKLEDGLNSLPDLESQLSDADARYRGVSKQRDDALVNKGVLEQQIEKCNSLEAEIRKQGLERRKLVDEKSIYDELTVAFGKNGIQALMIESAIPQLEIEANELLGRLTENRMFLKLQLLEGRKDRNTGMRAEELDIKIADEVGTRSYETFSGGEAFRINFALRIALSKLLARRSGAPLPILFIDEGFGSQDTSGQERLTEAIRSIQDDFEKIIVITHIEQVKDAFPVRIEITKDGNGSTFAVV